MILNDNSTQQINTLVIQLQNRITNLNNELNKKVSEINDKISDLDTLKKEIADLVKDQINVDSSMNTQITENKNNIAANTSSISALNTQIQTNKDNIATNTSDISALKTSVAGKADKIHTHTKSEITDFPTSLPANGGTATKARLLDQYVGRPTSGNIKPKDATEYGGMRKDVVTSSMTDSGYPGKTGHLLTMFWDSDSRWDNQLFISNDVGVSPELKVRQKQDTADYGSWVDLITSQNIGSQTVAKASTADKIEPNYTTNVELSAVTSETIKYIKIADCVWYQAGTLQVYLRGNCLEDTLVINFGGGNAQHPMLCGYYHGNSHLVSSVITQNGAIWNSGYSIYAKVKQLENCIVDVAILRGECTIDISESTTAPTNISEWAVDYGLFGDITAPNITNLEQRIAALESKA